MHSHPRKHRPTLSTIPSAPTSPTPDSTSANPWNPPTPLTILRRDFRSFTDRENMRRASRGEAPFCSPSGREHAFAKLMRLSRGEEPIYWKIDSRPEPGDELDTDTARDQVSMCHARFVAAEETESGTTDEGSSAETKVEAEGEVEGDGKRKGKNERKDSAQGMAGGSGWRRLVGRVVNKVHEEKGTQEKEKDGGSTMQAEHIEDIDAQ